MHLKSLISCVLAIIALPLGADDTHRLKTEFQDVPPKYIVEKGVPSGLSYEILKLIETKSGYTFVYQDKLVPLARVSKNLEDGITDIQFGIQKTSERERGMIFGPILYKVKLIGVMRKDDVTEILSLPELVEQKAVVLTQYGTGAAASLKTVSGLMVDDQATSVDMNIKKLLAGRGKIMIYHNLTLNYVIRASKYKDLLKMVELNFGESTDFVDIGQYLVYSKKTPQRVMDDINQAVRDASDNGELQSITDKYLK